MSYWTIHSLLIFAIPLATPSQDWTWAPPIPIGDFCYSLSIADSMEVWLTAGGSGIVSHASELRHNLDRSERSLLLYA
jgi:hypothetical protein